MQRKNVMDFWNSLWNIVVVFFMAFIFISALFALISIIGDLFRDKELSGWLKALWLIFLVFVPLITALIYLIARGEGMSQRAEQQYRESQDAAASYVREIANSATAPSPTAEIERAQALLAAGTITQAEFEAIKAKALDWVAAR